MTSPLRKLLTLSLFCVAIGSVTVFVTGARKPNVPTVVLQASERVDDAQLGRWAWDVFLVPAE